MTYQFGPDEPIAEATRRIAREEIDGAIEALSWEDRDLAVHDIRKRTKKLRALLRLVHDDADRQATRARIRAIRDAARAIAPLRDSRILVDAVGSLRLEAEAEVPELATVQEALSARHRELCTRQLDDEGALAHLEPLLHTLREGTAAWGTSGTEFAAIAPRLAETYAKGQHCFELAKQNPTLKSLHEWRKVVKDLWYQASLLLGTPGLEGPQNPGEALVADLDMLGGHLGLDHDFALLRQVVTEGTLPELEPTDETAHALVRLVDQHRADLQAVVWPLGEKVYAGEPEAFVARVDQLRSGTRTGFRSATD